MSLERVFVICINGSCRFVLSLLVFPSFLVQPCFFACFLRKQKR